MGALAAYRQVRGLPAEFMDLNTMMSEGFFENDTIRDRLLPISLNELSILLYHHYHRGSDVLPQAIIEIEVQHSRPRH